MTTLDERHGEGARDGDGGRGEIALDPTGTRGPATVPLDLPGAALSDHTGSKAANLARAAAAGLPVLPGFVIPHGGGEDTVALRRAWQELSDGGARPLVVRSSSPQEDTEDSSLAGQFASVLDVRGWRAFREAVRTVLDSARRPDGSTAPMAVLVQPMLTARIGGVMFGADPVEGRADRMLVSVVWGGPDGLVSGEQAGTNHWLNRYGRLLRTEPSDADSPLTRTELARLARLARRARRVFGGPQDIEFGFDGEGRLWLFQSRPITAMAARPARGARLLGPGPVAETLPGQLTPLEADLWVAPMARGLAASLDIGGSASRRLLRTQPVVTTVGGRAAADLRLLGAVAPKHRWLALLNPAPGARRLAAAWRVGRLGAALPGLATDLLADVDRQLAEIPPPADSSRAELVTALRWSRAVLVSLHAQEALAGALLRDTAQRRTAAGAALTALADARARGVPDDRVTATDPVILALTAPALRGPGRLPDEQSVPLQRRQTTADLGREPDERHHAEQTRNAVPARHTEPAGHTKLARNTKPAPHTHPAPNTNPARHRELAQNPEPAQHPHEPHPTADLPPRTYKPHPTPNLPPRESLRLRIRWVQELQVRLVREAGARMGLDVERVGLLRWRELAAVLEGAPLPADLHARVPDPASPPLPDTFRLAADGVVVAERADRSGDGTRGVSSGRAVGTVWDGTGPRPPDAVLVVRTLDPALAPLLPGLVALVAQTGSPLSHLAVLAREFGLPAVVGTTDAVHRFPPGSRLTVDGTAGDVQPGDVQPGDVRPGDVRPGDTP
ncbi:PEP/pyruvate-binding domain-containing protein [Streptomyces sp. NBC_00588]|uniref:PEP/pyruvate-binding domain-containing protein n=1 Tax=Streptomyces sp. NBC_00588 TaxID=2975784 RepID=UPI002E8137AC|nr:PEP/pyruvate-binding domain-containing protein [Streptomyces sp. NBC_00588]WUB39130.1 PEP-utilizing enzyme [Streptomyces sp. NBC_00588]